MNKKILLVVFMVFALLLPLVGTGTASAAGIMGEYCPCSMPTCDGIHDPFCMEGEDGPPRFFAGKGNEGAFWNGHGSARMNHAHCLAMCLKANAGANNPHTD